MFFRMKVERMSMKSFWLETIATVIVCAQNHRHDREFCRDKVFAAYQKERSVLPFNMDKDPEMEKILINALEKDLGYMWQEWRIENADC